MKVLVCASKVPDTTAKIAVGADKKSIDSKGIKFILNPYDEFAIEEGIRIKEKSGGDVTVITVGDDSSQEILRTALAMGCDTAIHIKTNSSPDSYQVAENLAAVAKNLKPDLIIMGRQSIDFDSLQVPSITAELLDIPSVSVVVNLTIDGNKVTAEREVEGGKEVVSLNLPCLISAQKGLNEPRYPKLPDIMKAKKKPIEEVAFIDSGKSVEVLEIHLPDKKRVGKIVGDSDAEISEVVKMLHEDSKVI
ncbi:MAG TPA: electron transfer flavoprotein subunit beta/FixA family protein [Candidatus Kapabacteria bacterium]|nr:electron transfer flavoprotein subunit beta/FixA family protein [Candidatus Kapabacteria bacterium]